MLCPLTKNALRTPSTKPPSMSSKKSAGRITRRVTTRMINTIPPITPTSFSLAARGQLGPSMLER